MMLSHQSHPLVSTNTTLNKSSFTENKAVIGSGLSSIECGEEYYSLCALKSCIHMH